MLCDTCANNINVNTFDEATLFHYITCSRHELSQYLKNNMISLKANNLRRVISSIITSKDIMLCNIMDGFIGPQHNATSAFSIFPTTDFFDCILEICRTANINRIEELCAGTGLFFDLFSEYKSKNENQNISIHASDGNYAYNTQTSLSSKSIKNKDIADYIMSNNTLNGCYIVINPDTTIGHRQILNELKMLMTIKKVPIMIFIGNEITNTCIDTSSEYNKYTVIPNIITKYDDSYSIEQNETFAKCFIFVKKTLGNFNFIVDMFKQRGSKCIANKVNIAIKQLVQLKYIPPFMESLDVSQLSEYIRMIYTNKSYIIPLYLNNCSEVEAYLNLYQIAKDYTGVKPDDIDSREKFNAMRKYLDMAFLELPYLKKVKVIPSHVITCDQAYYYILIDYFYKSKKHLINFGRNNDMLERSIDMW